MHQQHQLARLLDNALWNRMGRRALLRRAAGLGLSAPALAALLCTHAAAQGRPQPPDAPARPHTFTWPGGSEVDPYAWLENRDDPAVMAYLQAENAYTDAIMAPTQALQGQMVQEILGHIAPEEASVPFSWHGYLYFIRRQSGKDQALFYRQRNAAGAPEELILDPNALATEFATEYLLVGGWLPSPDNRYLVYWIDTTGAEIYTLFVKDLESGSIVDAIPGTYGSGSVWGPDSRTLFYVMTDEEVQGWFNRAYRHRVGDDPATDRLLYQEGDERLFIDVLLSKDGQVLFLDSSAAVTNEVRYLPTDDPDATPQLFAPQADGVLWVLEHHGDEILALTNEHAPNFKVIAAPMETPQPEHWRELIPHREDRFLADMADLYRPVFDVSARYLVLLGREDGLPRLFVHDLERGQLETVAFEEPTYAVFVAADPKEFASTTMRFYYSSLVTPWRLIEYDMATGERTMLHQNEVLDYDPSRYVEERIFATSTDGTRVPISLVYRQEGFAPGPRPFLLDGYGGFGTSEPADFSEGRLPLLDRGVGYAVAHVRGGTEYGGRWWDEGRLRHKKNVFADFIACAEQLIADGYTSPDRLAVQGASNGGLLPGVLVNERPDLIAAAIAEVPVADVIGFLLRSVIGPASIPEYGDPNDPEVLRYQRSYSPYQNVHAGAYPHILATGGLADPRVDYWVPAKWVAKLRDLKTDDTLLLLRMGEVGHGGGSGLSERAREAAFMWAFVLRTLGVVEAEPG